MRASRQRHGGAGDRHPGRSSVVATGHAWTTSNDRRRARPVRVLHRRQTRWASARAPLAACSRRAGRWSCGPEPLRRARATHDARARTRTAITTSPTMTRNRAWARSATPARQARRLRLVLGLRHRCRVLGRRAPHPAASRASPTRSTSPPATPMSTRDARTAAVGLLGHNDQLQLARSLRVTSADPSGPRPR